MKWCRMCATSGAESLGYPSVGGGRCKSSMLGYSTFSRFIIAYYHPRDNLLMPLECELSDARLPWGVGGRGGEVYALWAGLRESLTQQMVVHTPSHKPAPLPPTGRSVFPSSLKILFFFFCSQLRLRVTCVCVCIYI